MHVRAIDAALADLPADARRALQRFDPDGCALVVTSLFSQLEAVAGRRVLGARPQAWRRLEDKTLVDAVWDAAGVARVPSAVVPATRSHLLAAAADLDRGLGTVW
ncbi:MAG: hypothetical protein M3276_03345, partial [Actinomycetota bacterium]|nr:hypothetical protein [Actinomycetota bacterium]